MNVDHTINKTEFKKAVIYNLKISYRRTIEDATAAQMYQAVALAVKDMIIDRWIATHKEYEKPVSYTHLDVYKRQHCIRTNVGSILETPCRNRRISPSED